MLRSRVMRIVLLTWTFIAAFSEECVAKLVYRVLLLYLVKLVLIIISKSKRPIEVPHVAEVLACQYTVSSCSCPLLASFYYIDVDY